MPAFTEETKHTYVAHTQHTCVFRDTSCLCGHPLLCRPVRAYACDISTRHGTEEAAPRRFCGGLAGAGPLTGVPRCRWILHQMQVVPFLNQPRGAGSSGTCKRTLWSPSTPQRHTALPGLRTLVQVSLPLRRGQQGLSKWLRPVSQIPTSVRARLRATLHGGQQRSAHLRLSIARLQPGHSPTAEPRVADHSWSLPPHERSGEIPFAWNRSWHW